MAGVGDTGSAGPTLLFVHGFACAAEDWDTVIAVLAPRFRCLAPDLPGHGVLMPPEVASIKAMADELGVQRNEIEWPVVLIGHSIGCKIIREMYCSRPGGVAGMVFVEGAFYGGNALPMRDGAELYIEVNGFGDFIRDHFGSQSCSATDPEFLRYAIQRAQAMDSDFGREFFLSGVAFDDDRREATLANIEVPVLVLQSTWMDPTGRRVALEPGRMTPFMEQIQSLVPDVEIVTVTGSGHFPMRDRADAVAAEISDFVDALDGPGGKGRHRPR